MFLTDAAQGGAGVTTPRLVLCHGAGAPMDSDWMNAAAAGLAARGITVLRFELPYMAARRRGERRPPDRQPVLLDAWRDAIAAAGEPSRLAIGGKSLGGRIASMVADEQRVARLVCFGYPFHPPGKPEQLRVAHLRTLRTPALIVQGERDPFGTRAEVAGYELAPQIQLAWLPDGDHSFKPRKRSGHTEAGNLQQALDSVAAFIVSE